MKIRLLCVAWAFWAPWALLAGCARQPPSLDHFERAYERELKRAAKMDRKYQRMQQKAQNRAAATGN